MSSLQRTHPSMAVTMLNPIDTKGRLAEAWQPILQYLGWGDAVEGGVWFMGLEESCPWTEEDVLRHLKKEITRPFDPINEGSPQPALGHKGAAIRARMARIAATLSRSYRVKDPDSRWREYAETMLWRRGWGLCQGNLYPLGKPTLDAWPNEYTEWFGFGPAAYQAACEEQRIPVVHASFKKLRPTAVICFGEYGWPQFKRAFGVEEELLPRETAAHKKFPDLHAEFYRSGEAIIVLTPFLARPMTNLLADKVAARLVSLGVGLP